MYRVHTFNPFAVVRFQGVLEHIMFPSFQLRIEDRRWTEALFYEELNHYMMTSILPQEYPFSHMLNHDNVVLQYMICIVSPNECDNINFTNLPRDFSRRRVPTEEIFLNFFYDVEEYELGLWEPYLMERRRNL